MSEKHQMRAAMRALRKRLAEADSTAAVRAADHAGELPHGETVALYRAVGSELDPEPLGRALLAQGRRLCLPAVIARDAPMIFRAWSPGEPLEMDQAGCPAPLPLAAEVRPDLIVTPDEGGGPRVQTYSGNGFGTLLPDFFGIDDDELHELGWG